MKRCTQPADREDDRPGEKRRDDRPGIGTEKRQHAVPGRQVERGVHAEHQEIALGEIDDPHRAEDDAEPDAHQRIGAADQDAGRERLQKSISSNGMTAASPGVSSQRSFAPDHRRSSHGCHRILMQTTPRWRNRSAVLCGKRRGKAGRRNARNRGPLGQLWRAGGAARGVARRSARASSSRSSARTAPARRRCSRRFPARWRRSAERSCSKGATCWPSRRRSAPISASRTSPRGGRSSPR